MSRHFSLGEIRSEACNKTLVAFTVISAPLLLISLSRAFEQGWRPLLTAHTLLYVLMIGMTVFRNRLPISLRGGFLVGLLFVLGVSGMLTYGFNMGSTTYFVTGCLFAAAFFSIRASIVALILSSVVIMLFWAGHVYGVLPDVVDPNTYKYNFTSWLGIAATVVLCACGAMFALYTVTQALEAERARADAAANARGEFLARMSHELRTPMTTVIGMAELMQSTALSPDQSTMNARLLKAAHNLLELVNDVLDFSKADAGRLVVENASFSISEVVNEVIDLFATTATQRDISLTTHFPTQYVDGVFGDSFKLGQVLSNLIGNAVKFTEHGSVSVDVTQHSGPDNIARTTFTVTDSGIGISAEELTRLFQPFVQADSSTTRKYGGSGLGLVISKNLVQAMGGELTVQSTPGQGSTFSFTLPLQPDHAAATKPMTSPTKVQMTPETPRATQPLMTIQPGLRILLADDDPLVHTLIKIVLEDSKAIVTSVDNGAKAVTAMYAGKFDLVLIDMHMPEMNGIDATRGIRESNTNTPIIALTADIISDGKKEVLAAGANAVVSKPIDWRQLQNEINRLVALKK